MATFSCVQRFSLSLSCAQFCCNSNLAFAGLFRGSDELFRAVRRSTVARKSRKEPLLPALQPRKPFCESPTVCCMQHYARARFSLSLEHVSIWEVEGELLGMPSFLAGCYLYSEVWQSCRRRLDGEAVNE